MRFAIRDWKNPWILVALAVGVLALSQILAGAALRSLPVSFGRGGISAVFLANGQVYFGRVASETERSVTLTEIYYLKLAKPVLTQEDLQSQADASLVKLGNELHGPEDRMEIMRGQILFMERLKADGKVAKAIEQYRTEGSKTK